MIGRPAFPTSLALCLTVSGCVTVPACRAMADGGERPGAAELWGTVRDADSGEPLRGARVLLRAAGRETTTDSGGRYRLTRVPAGPDWLEVRLIGLVPTEVAVEPGEPGPVRADVSMPRWVLDGTGPGSVYGVPDTLPSRIVIDGQLVDWAYLTRDHFSDPLTPGSPLDLRRIEAADDPEALFLRLELGEPANVQGLPGVLSLALDVDGDSATGRLAEGLHGTDLVIDFTRRDPETGDLHEGVEVRLPARPGSRLDPDRVGLMLEPRYAAASIELRIARGVELPGGIRTFARRELAARLVFRDAAGVVRDEMDPLVYELATAQGELDPARAGVADEGTAAVLGRASSTAFRVVSWNVARESLFDDAEPIARILFALDPDLVLLDEVPPGATEADVRRVLPDGRSARGPAFGWSVHVGTSGGDQRGVVAARGGLRPEGVFARVRYPDSIHALLADPPTRDLGEVAASAGARGVPATGARVEIAAGGILAVALDFVCCGNSAGALEDRVRRVQAAAVNAAADSALRTARSSGEPVDAVLLAGDFNLVGSRLPLDLAADGLDLDGSALEPVPAPQLDGRSTATWAGRGGPFPPGRLDYVLYSGASLRPLGAFAFETDDLSPEGLARHGLRADDSAVASDHLPVVVDFAWIRPPTEGPTPP